MKEKLSILILISCLLILVSMSIASVSAVDIEMEEGEEELVPITLVHHADAGKPYSGSVGQNIYFDGSGTFIASYATYKWDFDDGNIGYGKYPTHSYSAPGEYYVTLTVKTISGKIYMDDTLVYINQENDHLEPYGGCHYHGNVAETITFDASDSVSTDPNLPIVEYIWYFSDGTKKTGQQVTHSFEDARVYTVTLYVVDSEGRTRRDFLHADINQDYTNKWDFFKNIDNRLKLILESLFDGLSDYLLDEFDVKIYTKYNNIEKYTDLDSLSKLPLSIDVNNDGPDDVVLNEIEVLKYEWGPSLFANQGMDWYQFETTISNLDKTSNSDIGIDDNFTICLQFNFGSQLAGYLDLDTPIARIGYNSPSGEVMPDSISLTHIFKPYLLQRWRNIFNTGYETTFETTQTTTYPTPGTIQSTTQQIVTAETQQAERTETTQKSVRTETIPQATTEEGTSDEGATPVGAEGREMEMEEESEPLESVPLVNEPSPLGGLENEYWPEYGLRMECSGGTKLSMVRMFLKSETQNTGLVLNIGVDCDGPEASMVYKVKKDGGIFHRGLRFAIPQDVGEISIARKEYGVDKTRISTDMFFEQQKINKIIWDNSGDFIHFESKQEAGLKNFVFYNENPPILFELDGISFQLSGLFKLNFAEGIDLEGEAGFTLKDLNFETSNFNAEINGTLSVSILNDIKLGFYQEGSEIGIKIGFTDALTLSSDCIYELNEFDVTLKGDFSFNSANSEIRFALDNGNFIIKLAQGPTAEIDNFYFNVGSLTVEATELDIGPDSEVEFSFGSGVFTIDVKKGPSLDIKGLSFKLNELTLIADNIEIGAKGRFQVEWDTNAPSVKVSGGTGANLVIENVNILFSDLEIDFDGHLDIDANGWIEFKPYNFGIGFEGLLDIASVITMTYQGDVQSATLQGDFTLANGGSVEFNWENHFAIIVSGGPELSINSLLFEVGDLSISSSQMVIGADGVIEFIWADNLFSIDVGGGAVLDILNLDFSIGSISVDADKLKTGANGLFVAEWDTNIPRVEISASSGAFLELKNVNINYADFHLGIGGTLTIGAGGSLTVTSDEVTASFNGEFIFENCVITINTDQITIGGTFSLTTDGTVAIQWGTGRFAIDVTGGPQLTISDLNFEVGDLSVTATSIQVGLNSDFEATWSIGEDITISAGTEAALYVENIEIYLSSVIDFDMVGSLSIDASGYIILGTTNVEASIDGSLELSSGFQFTINAVTIAISGDYTISTGGIIQLRWANDQFTVELIAGTGLSIDNLYFDVNPLTIEMGSGSISADGDLNIFLNKDNKYFEIASFASFDILDFIISHQDEHLSSLDEFDIGGGGSFKVFGEPNFQISINFDGSVNIDGFFIDPPSSWNWGLKEFSIGTATYSGNAQINIQKPSTTTGKFEIIGTPINFILTELYIENSDSSFKIDLEELSTDSSFIVSLTSTVSKLEVDGSFEVTNLNSNLGSANLDVSSIDANGDFLVSISSTISELSASGSFTLSTLDADLGNVDFDITSINANLLNSLYLKLGKLVTPEINLNGLTDIEASNIDLTIDSWYLRIPGIDIDGNGEFIATWTEESLTTNINGYFNWDIEIETTSLGDWETLGDLQGDIAIIAQKQDDSGILLFDIGGSGIHNNLKVIHGVLTLEVGMFNLDPGSIKFEWQKEVGGQPGTLDITNSGFSGTLASCKITYADADPLEILLGSVSTTTGLVNIKWYRDASPHFIELDSSLYIDADPLKFIWGSKVLTFDALEFEPGKFFLGWDDSNPNEKEITVKNSITNFGAGVSYEDTSQDLKLSANLGGLNDDYTNTITIICYKDSTEMTGIYLDSGGEQLATLITVEAIKENTGRRIELDGLEVDGFYLKKEYGEIKIGGKIWLVNGFTFSKMIDENIWLDFEADWNLASEGYIEFNIDDGFEDDWNIVTKILDVDIYASIENLAEHLRFGWDAEDLFTSEGYIQIDTNYDPISEIGFTVEKVTQNYDPLWGFFIYANGLAAENYEISWDFSVPPSQWVFEETGYKEPGSISQLDVGLLGNWYNIFGGGPT